MSLTRIYIDADLCINQCLELPAAASHYIKHVLRLKTEQEIVLFNGKQPVEYTARLEIAGKKVIASLILNETVQLESPIKTILFQAMGKPEHVDLVIQKATELGINQIYLFNSQRTQTHLKSARLLKKMAHWQGIIISACEQCGRNSLPTLTFIPTLQACLEKEPSVNKIILNFTGKSIKALDSELNPDNPFSMLVGPEGGLTDDEIQLSMKAGFRPCTLGPRILRMETAALSILNIIQHHYGDM